MPQNPIYVASLVYYLQSHKRVLLWPSLFFLIGATYPCTPVILAFLVPLAGLLIVAFLPINYLSRNRRLVLIPILVSYAAGGAFGLSSCRLADLAEMLSEKGETYQVEVLPLEKPETKSYQVRFIGEILWMYRAQDFLSLSPDDSNRSGSSSGSKVFMKVLISLQKETTEICPGDILTLRGKFSLPRRAMNPGEFNYRDYLAHKGVFGEFKGLAVQQGRKDPMKWPSIWVFIKAAWTRVLWSVREAVEKRIERTLPEKEAGVFKSILLGERNEIDKGQKALFEEVGLYRLLGTTGFHVDFVAKGSERLTKKVTKSKSLSQTISIFIALFYTLLTGVSTGALRAFLFHISKIMAPRFLRKHDSLQALSVSAVLVGMTVRFPLSDAGFQLSFMAVTGAVLGYNLTRTRMGGSLGVLLALLPLLAYHFQEVSLAGFAMAGFWNICVMMLIYSSPLILLVPFRYNPVGWMPFLLVRGLETQSHIAARFPLSSITLPRPTVLDVLLCYFLTIAVLLLIYGPSCGSFCGFSKSHIDGSFSGNVQRSFGSRLCKSFFYGTALFALSLAMFATSLMRFHPLWPRVVFLSVGQGDSAVIRFRDKVVLIDTGTKSAFENTVFPYLLREGIREVDLLILSHLHQDHAGGLPFLGEAVEGGTMKLGTVLIPFGTRGEVVHALYQADPKTGQKAGAGPTTRLLKIEITEAREGETYRLGGVFCEILWSRKGEGDGDENVNAIVARIFFQGGIWALEFWGDSPKSVVMALEKSIAQKRVESRRVVVKVPHHGSVHSLSETFYDDLKGQDAVISVGPNSYGHPSPQVMYTAREKGATIWRTDKQGAMTVKAFLDRVKVFAYVPK